MTPRDVVTLIIGVLVVISLIMSSVSLSRKEKLSINPTSDEVLTVDDVKSNPALVTKEIEFVPTIKDLINNALPIGSIIAWGSGTLAIPTGWHPCDGNTYAGIKTPDLKNNFVYGASTQSEIGAGGGKASVTLTAYNIPPHAHHIPVWMEAGSSHGISGWDSATQQNAETVYTDTDIYTTGSLSGKVPTVTPFDIIPPYIKLMYICKCENI